jgi:glycerol-3-phosphate dehydrogenase
MNIALIMTAVKLGATVANKVEVTQLLKNADGKIEGAHVRDNLTGKEWDVKARVLISCSGWINSMLNAYLTDRAWSTPQVPSPMHF